MALNTLREIARALSDSLSPSEIANVVADNLQERFGGSAAVVYFFEEGTKEAKLAAARGIPPDDIARLDRLPLTRRVPLTTALLEKAAVWYETRAALEAAYPEIANATLPASKLKAALALPFSIDHHCVGGMAVSFSSERRFEELERELLLTIADLAAQSIERSRLLESEKTARDALAHANRVKDEFLATLSHELRSPLNVIVGWMGMLRGPDVPPARLAKGLAIIDRNVKAQVRLIEDVLDVSRIISGKLRLVPKPTSIWKIVLAACEGMRPVAEDKGITLTTRAEEDDPFAAVVDPERIQQVVGNLLSNAVKFTPAGGRVDVAVRRVDSKVAICVTDSGEGIDPELLPIIFERFRQGSEGTARRHGGLGLGLSICRHLVEMHDGKIEARSDGRGRGASFTVTLPVPGLQRPLRQDGHPRPDLPDVDGLRVLVCDDEDDAREMLAEVLLACGAVVKVAANGREALELLATRRFDLFLCDVGMPSEDGYSVLRSVRARPIDRGGAVPAVAITAYASANDAHKALQAGFNAHLPKPVQIERLLEVVAQLVRA